MTPLDIGKVDYIKGFFINNFAEHPNMTTPVNVTVKPVRYLSLELLNQAMCLMLCSTPDLSPPMN